MWLAAAAAPAAAAAQAESDLWRQRAAITVERQAALVRLPLPLSAYAASDGRVSELRVVDASGARVPFAVLDASAVNGGATGPRAEAWREVRLYRLPPRPAQPGATWALPVEVVMEGGRTTVRQRAASAAAGAGAAGSAAQSPGWLLDLGDPVDPGDKAERAASAQQRSPILRLRWSGQQPFVATYSLEHSTDLREWQAGGAGQLMALSSDSGALTQPDVALPARSGRFVRLLWSNPADAPPLSAAQVGGPLPHTPDAQPLTEVAVAPVAAPPDEPSAPGRALHFDLGANLPLDSLSLSWTSGAPATSATSGTPGSATRVWPAQVQWRERADAPWVTTASTVFYQLDRDGTVSRPPPLRVSGQARFVRLLVDERAGLPQPAGVQLLAQANLASLVFAAQGTPPYALLAGPVQDGRRAVDSPGALPLATLVPDLAAERARLGLAGLGPWSEQPAAARRQRDAQRLAGLRPWLLWALLLAGVAGLGVMVWRLAQSRTASL